MEPGPWTFGWDQLIGIGNILALVGVAIYAGNKVEQIRSERFTHRQAEVADECLQAIYETHDALRRVRGIFSFGDPDGPLAAYLKRLNSEEVFETIRTLRPRVKAYISAEAFGRLEDILSLRMEVIHAIHDVHGPDATDDRDEKNQARRIAYYTGSKDDVIMSKFKEIEKEAESELLPIIGRKI